MNQELTRGMRYRLSKDFQLPITLFDDENYIYFRDLYDSFFKISEKEEKMRKVLEDVYFEKNGNVEVDKESSYFNYSADTNNKLKAIIKNSKAYQLMNDDVIHKNSDNAERRNIYIEENYGKRLISIDLNKANFNVFDLYGLKDELKIKSYDDFVRLATPHDYFVASRMTRQVVFGDLNPKRQQAVQTKIINEFAKILKKEGLNLTSSSSDEIIIDPNDNDSITMAFIADVLKDVPENKRFFRVEEFVFNKINPDSDYGHFFKTSIDLNGNVKEVFKSVPNLFFPQIFKHKFNMPLDEKDMLFFHEGRLARFMEPIYLKNELTKENRFRLD